MSKKVFLAPSIFIALIDRSNQKHPQAAAYFRYFVQEKFYLYTSYLSIAEAYRTIYSQISPSLAREFLRTIVLGSINVIYPSEGDLKATVKAIVTSQSSELKFSDAQMAVIAYRNNIPQIATFEYLHPLFGLNTFSLPV